MRAWRVERPGPIGTKPLRAATLPIPEPAPGEVLVRVLACGVCRTDLHVAEGDLPVHRPGVVPGHEVVGEVVARRRSPVRGRDRVGIAWLRGTDGTCRYCLRGNENLCPASAYTGWDADGGYAEYAVVPADLRAPAAGRLLRGGSWRRCCAPGSSATARCDGPTCRRAAGWGSTASAAARTWPPRSRSPGAPRCTC